MRIAFFVGAFPRLSQTFILNQITGLIDRGHTIHVYGELPNDIPDQHSLVQEYALLDIVRYRPSLPKGKVARYLKAFNIVASDIYPASLNIYRKTLNVFRYKWIVLNLSLLYSASICYEDKVLEYDVIHAHFGFNGSIAAALRDMGLIKGKIVTTFHGADVSKHLRRWGVCDYSLLAKEGDMFLPVSQKWRDKLINIGFPEDRIKVHHMGVDPSSVNSVAGSDQCDNKGLVRLVTVARLVEKKGVAYAIRALAKSLSESKMHVQYTIVGDGPLRAELERLVQSLDIEAFVDFRGWQTKSGVSDILQKSDMFLAPSITAKNGDQEGIPVAIMEAMAHGLPVISTLHSGIPELVQDRVSGILVPESDIDSLACAISTLLSDRKKRIEMGKSGRLTVEAHFNIHQLNAVLEEHYRFAMSL